MTTNPVTFDQLPNGAYFCKVHSLTAAGELTTINHKLTANSTQLIAYRDGWHEEASLEECLAGAAWKLAKGHVRNAPWAKIFAHTPGLIEITAAQVDTIIRKLVRESI